MKRYLLDGIANVPVGVEIRVADGDPLDRGWVLQGRTFPRDLRRRGFYNIERPYLV
jgi:hypothetical protein